MREAGISVCAGGIIGLGEGPKDRVGLIHQLATLPEHPESVPINALVAVAGKLSVICDKRHGEEQLPHLSIADSHSPQHNFHQFCAEPEMSSMVSVILGQCAM